MFLFSSLIYAVKGHQKIETSTSPKQPQENATSPNPYSKNCSRQGGPSQHKNQEAEKGTQHFDQLEHLIPLLRVPRCQEAFIEIT